MKPILSLSRLAAVAALSLAGAAAHAAPTQLVVNGEFESPVIGANTWTCTAVPGWTSSAGCLEIWGATYNPEGTKPALGSDGLAHGQHHELTLNSNTEFTTQSALIAQNGTVDFSFDGWRRAATGIQWSLTGTLSGLLAEGLLELPTDAWRSVSVTGLAVQAGESLTMRFQSVGRQGSICGTSQGCGAHIDQVSLLYTVPEPTPLALLGLGLAALTLTRRAGRHAR